MSEDTHEHESHAIFYFTIWLILLILLFVSLIIGMFGSSACVVAVIFVIAAVKAGLVVTYFMHLPMESIVIKMLMLGALTVLGVFYFGLYPDIVMNRAGVVEIAQDTIEEELIIPGDAVAGKKVYDTYCWTCHQKDGSGRNGTSVLAASFTDDSSRLAKSDEELMQSVYEGMTGKVGTMPPAKSMYSKQQVLDALSYVRQEFGDPKQKAAPKKAEH